MLFIDERRVLDHICDQVGRKLSPGMVGWSIGTRKAVVSEIASQLQESEDDVNEQIGGLVEAGYLQTSPKIAETSSAPDEEHLGITQQGWQRWSYFDETDCDDWDNLEFEEWLVWDGGINEPPRPSYFEVFQSPKASTQSAWRAIDES